MTRENHAWTSIEVSSKNPLMLGIFTHTLN